MNQHEQNLISYIDEIIQEYGFADVKDVIFDLIDKDILAKLAGLIIETKDRDTSECFYDPSQYIENDKITCALLNVLDFNNQENREDLAQLIINRCINQHKDYINELFIERIGEHYSSLGEGYDNDYYGDFSHANW